MAEKQKFPILAFVKTVGCREGENVNGIVCGTYAQIHHGNDVKNYMLWVLKRGKVIDKRAWFPEGCIRMVSGQDAALANSLIEAYISTRGL